MKKRDFGELLLENQKSGNPNKKYTEEQKKHMFFIVYEKKDAACPNLNRENLDGKRLRKLLNVIQPVLSSKTLDRPVIFTEVYKYYLVNYIDENFSAVLDQAMEKYYQ